MYTRKPIGPTQYEISQGKTKQEFNRANDVRRDDDTVKDQSIGFHDIDNAIQYYFENTIKPEIIEAGSKVRVPVVYGSPERWKTFQQDGYFRDKVGKILTPLIAYQRTSITKNRSLGNKIDGNYPQLYYTAESKYTRQNKYDAFSVLTNSKPIKEQYNTIIPDYVDITYNIVIWTNYVQDMNKIVESVLYSEGSYWGNADRFKFRTKIDSYTNTTDLLQDDERVVRTSFDLTIYGYIVSDALVKQLSDHLSPKTFTPRQIQINTEVDNQQELFQISNKLIQNNPLNVETGNKTTVINTTNVTYGAADSAALDYINIDRKKLGVVTVPSIVTFAGDIAAAPSTLAPTSIINFTFYINGTLIEPAAITSFTNSVVGSCVLTLNTTELGFTLASTDEVIAVGKFV